MKEIGNLSIGRKFTVPRISCVQSKLHGMQRGVLLESAWDWLEQKGWEKVRYESDGKNKSLEGGRPPTLELPSHKGGKVHVQRTRLGGGWNKRGKGSGGGRNQGGC